MVAALREAGRVAKPGAPVVIQVWGAHERCDLEAMKEIARPFLPPRPADAPPDPDLSQPGALEALATQAGLARERVRTTWASNTPTPRRSAARSSLPPVSPSSPAPNASSDQGRDRRRPRTLPRRRRQLPARERVPLPDRARDEPLRRHPRSRPRLARRRDLRTAGGKRPRSVHERARRRGIRPLRRPARRNASTDTSACCLIVNADSEAEIHRRLADDPWALTDQIRIASIEPWKILVGAERLTSGVVG